MPKKQKRNTTRERWCTIVQLICETLKFLWLSVFFAIMISYMASVASSSSKDPGQTKLENWVSDLLKVPFLRDVLLMGLAALILFTGISFFVRHHLIASDLNKKREEHYKNIEEIFNNSSEQEARASDLMLQEQQKLSHYEIGAFDQLLQEQQKISTFLMQTSQEYQKHSRYMQAMLSKQTMMISTLTTFLQEHSRCMKLMLNQQKLMLSEQRKKQEDSLYEM